MGSAILPSTSALNASSHHLACALSVVMHVLILEPGECAHASLASPPNARLSNPAATEKKRRWMECLMQDECVKAKACDVGAAHLDPLQHDWALLVPSLFMLHCQCGCSITGLSCLSNGTSFPNICNSSIWSGSRIE